MQIVQGIEEFLELRNKLSGSVGFVPTMGSLHEGHMALVKDCHQYCDNVIVSIYVNPLQFGPKEDFENYPRDLGKDQALLEEAGVDILFTPLELGEASSHTEVLPGELGKNWCGKSRPTHFKGVLTVLSKLFNLVRPQDVWFGQKDLQQFQIVKSWVDDFYLPVDLHRHPIVREKSGLAMSSRNAYLDLNERTAADNIYRSLTAAKMLFLNGEKSSEVILEQSRDYLRGMKIEYHAIVELNSMKATDEVFTGSALILAVKLGKTRLIDNMIFHHSPNG
jgi:pantoate--beta-alanine ligase